MEQQNVQQLLNDPNKGIDKAENLLSKWFRTILYDLNIGIKSFNNNLKDYLHDPNNGIEDNATARNNHRGNLMKEIASQNMSWNVFQKALRVIRVVRFELVINIQRAGSDKITQHVVYAQNNISEEQPKEDLSKANVINGFLSTKQKGTKQAEVHEPVKNKTSAEDIAKAASKGFKLPVGATAKK